jgi:glycosyltransferase involved in cell wall biosynthesis
MRSPSDSFARPKVIHVTTVHRPFDARIFHKQCVSLARLGYDVMLLQRDCEKGERAGVKIEPLRPRDSRLARMTLGVFEAVRRVLRERPVAVHLHDIELIWGGLLLRAAGIPVVIYDVHEDVAKDLEDKAYLPAWVRPPLRLLVKAIEWLGASAFAQLSAATTAIAARFPPDRVTLIRNTPIVGEMTQAAHVPFAERAPFAVYLGGLARFNGPLEMVSAMAQLPANLDAKLLLGGVWPDSEIERQAKALPGWSRVNELGWIDRARVGEVMMQARCGLVLYQPTANVIESEPNKFFECMSAGLPLVASNFPVWKALLERFECGIAVDPNDPAAVAKAIAFLLSNPEEAEAMGRRGQRAVLEGYNWGVDERELGRMYERLLSRVGYRQPADA